MKKKIGGFFLALLVPIIYIGGMLVLEMIAMIFMMIISAVRGVQYDMMAYNNLMIMSVIGMIGGIIVTFIYVKFAHKIPAFEKHHVNVGMVFLSIVLGLSTGLFAGNLPYLLFPNGKAATNAVTDDFTFLTVIVAAILAPIFEELVFRKYMLDISKKKGVPVAVIIVFSSIAFALSHDPTSIIYMTATFILGAVFAFSYHKSGVIVYCMIMHCANNTMACISTWSEKYTETPINAVETAEMTTSQSIIFTAICFAVMVVSLFAFCKLAKKNKDNSNEIINTPEIELA